MKFAVTKRLRKRLKSGVTVFDILKEGQSTLENWTS